MVKIFFLTPNPKPFSEQMRQMVQNVFMEVRHKPSSFSLIKLNHIQVRLMVQNVFICGGSSLFKGFRERIGKTSEKSHL
jgi:actin-related protein